METRFEPHSRNVRRMGSQAFSGYKGSRQMHVQLSHALNWQSAILDCNQHNLSACGSNMCIKLQWTACCPDVAGLWPDKLLQACLHQLCLASYGLSL